MRTLRPILIRRHLNVSFGPIDQLNPDSGYSLRIQDDRGNTLLFTGKAPDTGKDLRTPADCVRVLVMYLPRGHVLVAP